MDMLAYLTELIKTRKEVGIPGLGTIYKKKSPGRYDAETHSFLPPSYVLDFSSEVREQTLLIAHICKKRNISPDAATYYVDQFSDEIKKQLEEHEEASFYPLGTLYGSPETLSFKPVNDQNFGFDFYGLPPVKEEAELVAEPEEILPYSTEPVITDLQSEEEVLNEERDIHQVTEEQLELENSNADLREEEIPSLNPAEQQALSERVDEVVATEAPPIEIPAIEEKPAEELPVTEVYEVEEEIQPLAIADDQPVYEEIAEVELPKKPVEQPVIETVVPTTINDAYAQPNRAVFEPRPTPVPEQLVEREQITETGFYNSDGEYSDKAKTPVYLKILIALLLILIGLAAAYFIRPDLFDPILKRGESTTALPVESGPSVQDAKLTADSLAKADSLKRSSEKVLPIKDTTKKDSSAITKPAAAKPVVPKPETTIPVTPTTTATTPPAVETGTTYEVIGSSVTSQKEAERFIANMKSLGITAKAIPPTNGRKIIKLSIGSFKDYNTAHQERPKLEKKLGIKDTYIHTNKPL
ncbi:Sporulation related domain-containing protein [Pedobacter steynii]|uniref:Sporulation related domain-containing protein n=1 Tax=Pedobacter steynii TaxID=430522 RepID=A0A1G9T7R0_9SPHI|nr:SPOR domain-containing protein [Pedobacter steynii]NQX37213.1 SPOR domain-containing protein [Pedobacter steynii]SDM43662.1 Sporulation related domain-containing protein [Pedobacter steynii]